MLTKQLQIPEGYVLNRWFHNRTIRQNKNVILVVIGATGSGKSYSCLRIAELWYKEHFNEEFPNDNVCFKLVEAAKLVRNHESRRGEITIVEEAGILVNSLSFQNKLQKLFVAILQSARCKNSIFIFNLPMLSMLNKSARNLAHGILLTEGIDPNSKQVQLKPFYAQTDALSGKLYKKFFHQKFENRTLKVKKFYYGLPEEKLRKEYEEKKKNFVDGVLDKFIVETDKEDKKENGKEVKPEKEIPNSWKAIMELRKKGITKQKEIARILEISSPTVSAHMTNMRLKGLIVEDFLEKAKKFTEKPILAPIPI